MAYIHAACAPQLSELSLVVTRSPPGGSNCAVVTCRCGDVTYLHYLIWLAPGIFKTPLSPRVFRIEASSSAVASSAIRCRCLLLASDGPKRCAICAVWPCCGLKREGKSSNVAPDYVGIHTRAATSL